MNLFQKDKLLRFLRNANVKVNIVGIRISFAQVVNRKTNKNQTEDYLTLTDSEIENIKKLHGKEDLNK